MALIPLFPLSRALFPGGVLHCACSRCATWTWCAAASPTAPALAWWRCCRATRSAAPRARRRWRRWARWRASNPGTRRCPRCWRCAAGAGRFRLHASQLAKYGLWMGEAEAIADDPPAEVPADLQDCADALGRLIAGWQRGRAGRAHAAGAAVPAGRLRLGGRPLVRAAAAAGGRAGPAAGAVRPVARLAAVRQALRDAS